jgi:acetoin utilization protein AcuB
MLVGERMSHPVITIPPEMPIVDVLNLMKRERIRRTPVMQNGKLVGIVSDKDLLNASPSPAASLSVWEMNYLLSKITVKDVMSRKVLTVTEETAIEEAARIMVDSKIGGLPVLRGDQVVGIITETDLFKIFLELIGARRPGVRITMIVKDKRGELARISQAVADIGGNIIATVEVPGSDASNYEVLLKVINVSKDALVAALKPMVERITDVREG